jgi:hypothetical protein
MNTSLKQQKREPVFMVSGPASAKPGCIPERQRLSEGIDHVEKAWFAVRAGSAVVGRGGCCAGAFSLCTAPPPTTPYGAPIGIEDAKKAAAAAVAEVAKAGSPPDAIAIVDHGGFLIYFERMDNTQLGSVEIAIEKARSAALFRRPSKVFEDAARRRRR